VLAASMAVQVSSTDLEDIAAQLIEDFRTIMPTGLPEINIPVLEPAVIKTLPLSIKLSPFDAKVVASDIQVAGVSSFKFNKISQIDGTNKLAVEVEVPNVNVNGEYDIDGKVKIGFINVKLTGQGPLKLNIGGLKGQATVDVLINGDGSFNVNELNVDTWTYDSIEIQLDNLFDGGVMGKTVNTLINKLVPTFVKANLKKINQLVETIGMKVINRYLDGIAGKTRSALLQTMMHRVPEEFTLQDFYVSPEAQEILDQLAVVVVGSASLSTDLEDRVAQLIEDFRSMMPTGRPDINIPVLEPAVIKKLPVSVKISPFDANAVASNIEIAGISAFEITKLTQIEGTNKLSVAVEVPEIDVNGEYDVKGKVKIGIIKVGLNGNGPMTLNIKGLKGAATADVLVNDDDSLNLNTLQVDSWTYDEITIQLDNLFDGGALGKTVNILINKLVPTFIKANRSMINQLVEAIGTKIINQYLDGIAGKTKNTVVHRLALSPVPHHELTLENFVVSSEAQEILDQLAILAVNARMAIAA